MELGISRLYRMLETARKRNDRATEILVQARIDHAWDKHRISLPRTSESEARLMDGNR